MKILFVCTSNKDRSPALEKYFKEILPEHDYRSAGINKYFCDKKGTNLITEKDIRWADTIICAEDVHADVICTKFDLMGGSRYGYFEMIRNEITVFYKPALILNCGEYTQGCIGEDYLTKSEYKLKKHLSTI